MHRKKQIWFFALLSFLILAFIFSNSLQTADASNQRSEKLSGGLKTFLDPGNRLTPEAFNRYVRKAAHFSEFAALGFSLLGFTDAAVKKGRVRQFLSAWGIAAAAAFTDEFLQFFSDGRAPGVKDVMIDCAGAAFGAGVMLVLLGLTRRIKRRKGGTYFAE